VQHKLVTHSEWSCRIGGSCKVLDADGSTSRMHLSPNSPVAAASSLQSGRSIRHSMQHCLAVSQHVSGTCDKQISRSSSSCCCASCMATHNRTVQRPDVRSLVKPRLWEHSCYTDCLQAATALEADYYVAGSPCLPLKLPSSHLRVTAACRGALPC
jgi:hypothetical protein